jgi:hypothetical protein
MDNFCKESKASFFDRLYSLHDGVVSGDEDEGAPFDISLGSHFPIPPDRVKTNINITVLENTSPLKLTSRPGNAVTNDNISPDTAVQHQQKQPEYLRFTFVDEKAPKIPRKAAPPKIVNRNPTLFAGMYFCKNPRLFRLFLDMY